jgi:hypothetical protein
MFPLFPNHNFSCSVLYFPRFVFYNRENLIKAYETFHLYLLKILNSYQFRGHENYEIILAVWFDEKIA